MAAGTLLAAGAAGAAETPRIAQAPDRSVTVEARAYTARIDATGNLAEVLVGGAPSIVGGFFREEEGRRVPLDPAPSIRVIDGRVAVRAGPARIEYAFRSDRIDVETDGYPLLFGYDPGVRAVIAPGGGGAPGRGRYHGGSTGLVLGNNLTVVYDLPMHAGPPERRVLVPTAYLDGSRARGATLRFAFTPGRPAGAVQRLGALELLHDAGDAPPDGPGSGNRGRGLVHFADPAAVRFRTVQANGGPEPVRLRYALRVQDHYADAAVEAELEQAATLPAGGEPVAGRWDLPALEPGFHYLRVAAFLDGEEVSSARVTFAVDLPRYRRPLTRPGDFRAFWGRELETLRTRPMEPRLDRAPARDRPGVRAYDLELTGRRGRRYPCRLEVPDGPGPHPGRVAGQGDGRSVTVSAAWPGTKTGWPEEATFRRWEGADDNNLLECILLAVRMTDYLRSREDVDGIYLVGASRTGPIQYVNAALDPRDLVGLDIHVPTSAGIGRRDRPYRGWGGKPAGLSLEAWTDMARYVDPVNHAPDQRVPFIIAYGVDDDLSPPQGIELMYRLAPAPWKRVSRDAGGHQFSDGFAELRRELAARAGLGGPPERGASERDILREH